MLILKCLQIYMCLPGQMVKCATPTKIWFPFHWSNGNIFSSRCYHITIKTLLRCILHAHIFDEYQIYAKPFFIFKVDSEDVDNNSKKKKIKNFFFQFLQHYRCLCHLASRTVLIWTAYELLAFNFPMWSFL